MATHSGGPDCIITQCKKHVVESFRKLESIICCPHAMAWRGAKACQPSLLTSAKCTRLPLRPTIRPLRGLCCSSGSFGSAAAPAPSQSRSSVDVLGVSVSLSSLSYPSIPVLCSSDSLGMRATSLRVCNRTEQSCGVIPASLQRGILLMPFDQRSLGGRPSGREPATEPPPHHHECACRLGGERVHRRHRRY
jgi:hypothetical protein